MAGEQSASNVIVAIKREATPGVAAGAAGATRIRITSSPGLDLNTAIARSDEKRPDGNRQLGSHSSKDAQGSYNVDLTVGGALDIFFEAIMRSTWQASATKTQAEFTSAAIASNVITFGGGSAITQGFRVGQVCYLTGMTQAANNNVNFMVGAVTASTITAVGPTLVDEGADTTFSIVRRGNVFNAASPTKYHHTIDQYDADTAVDRSEQFLGMKLVGLSMNIVPGRPIAMTATFMGFDRVPLAQGASPYFTTPAVTTGKALVADDITLRFNGATVTKFTSMTLNWGLTAAFQHTIGTVLTADVFDNDLELTAQASILRSDHAQIALYDAKTEFEMGLLFQDKTTAAPFACVGTWFPVVRIDGLRAPVGGGDGAKVENLVLAFGTKPSGVSGYEATIATISSSAIA